ncbi:hypothetical protein SAMN06295998_1241 [Primorskyibacter flagellatus]|uniref:Uncharacterized protein n=1 Tax=Primorskyibacter flagellatus TaxID=1387277 RepID=A0A1W2E7H7_9RHOB|nr:hypothetical protein SAMN06295998_1241 [Primorskyibacter flagellatus]
MVDHRLVAEADGGASEGLFLTTEYQLPAWIGASTFDIHALDPLGSIANSVCAVSAPLVFRLRWGARLILLTFLPS